VNDTAATFILAGFLLLLGVSIGFGICSAMRDDARDSIEQIADGTHKAIRIDTPHGPRYYVVPIDWTPGKELP
jgi:hypothetical protein